MGLFGGSDLRLRGNDIRRHGILDYGLCGNEGGWRNCYHNIDGRPVLIWNTVFVSIRGCGV